MVRRWLEGQGFRVETEYLIDELGRPAAQHYPDRSEAEKHVLAWVRAYPRGVSMEDLKQGLADKVPGKELQGAVARLVETSEVEKRQARLFMGLITSSGVPVLPCPIRPDLYAFRGKTQVERWTVECKGTTGDIAHGIGQAYLYSKVSNRAFLAIPSDWPKLYAQGQKEHVWGVLRRLAGEQGFGLLRVGADGSVIAT
jgi:hypothetical protein